LAGIGWKPVGSGAPVLADALAWLECRLVRRVRAGDHELVIARPVGGEILRPDAIPLAFADTGELDGSRELYPPTLEP
ncbi:MAG TPA: flavin reductase, partial [Gemmatimonadales bacterium]|nr:flavin reductase [Gemmatimonadales bacterium]